MVKKHYLIIALDVAETAPGIVFKLLIRSLATYSDITLLAQAVDKDSIPANLRLLELHKGVEYWGKAQKKWLKYGSNPRDQRWAEKSFRKYKKEILSDSFDAIITLCSNGYYSSLNLGKIISEKLRRPYFIYSVDGMPSPLPWLGGDSVLHSKISEGLRPLCNGADLFILSNPLMAAYQKTVLPEFQGSWDYLFTPYRPLSADFSLKKHDGFNILYAGSLYGLRRIDGLIAAFRSFLGEKPDATLYFVGEVVEDYKHLAEDLVEKGKIVFKEPTSRIDSYYAIADCLIDIAADIPDDVFLSSKAICYLPYEIPVVAISGANSPVSIIMDGCESIIHCHNDADEILKALERSQGIRDFSDRARLLDIFSPESICRRFREIIEKHIDREPLIVSLTTWKARIRNIPAVLDSIFSQTLPPDKLVLNLATNEIVPDDIQAYLDSHKVEVNRVPDTKVYKKLIPTLKQYPEACIVNIDDDWIYPSGMLEEFVRIHRQDPNHPISGNREIAFHMACHCGCASLTKRRYFGQYLDWINDEVMENCPSDDIVFSYFATKNGYPYIHTDSLYFTNLTPYNPSEALSGDSSLASLGIQKSWRYLTRRYGHPSKSTAAFFFNRLMHWMFEIYRDPARGNGKYLRLFGIEFTIASSPCPKES